MDVLAKTEQAFADYLRHTVTGASIRPARSGGGPVAGPLIVVLAQNLQTHPDLPPADGTYSLDLAITLLGEAGDQPAALEDIAGATFCALLDIAGAQTFINGDSYALHLHDIARTSQSTGETESRPSITVGSTLAITNASA